jgi:hypothetical protein
MLSSLLAPQISHPTDPRNRVVGKSNNFFKTHSKAVKPIERPEEEAKR